MTILTNHSLKPFNTFGIDVKAKIFIETGSVEDLRHILSDGHFSGQQLLILGGGSNILFTTDFNGVVLRPTMKGIEQIKENSDHYYVKVACGENWHQVVSWCVERNYGGIENLSLIPGNAGAAPIQNIGAYGVELKDVFTELEALHIKTGEVRTFSNDDCRFRYRNSIFKNELKDQFIITAVTLRLSKNPVFNISYGAIEKELKTMGIKELSVSAISRAVIRIRSGKLPDPATIGNAGSFFKNPVVAKQLFEKIKKGYPDAVGFNAEEDTIKLAAGWLIEKCGWKGKQFNCYGVHTDHALVLVNYGGASGKDIYDLSEKIKVSVKEKFGVELEREVNVV